MGFIILFFLFLNLFYFYFLFLAVLGLHCCMWASLVAVSRGYFLLRYMGFSLQCLLCAAWALGVRASVVVSHRLSSCGSLALECRLSCCGTWA